MIGGPLGAYYSKFKEERSKDIKNLLCTVIGFMCSGLAHYFVEYETISIEKRENLIK